MVTTIAPPTDPLTIAAVEMPPDVVGFSVAEMVPAIMADVIEAATLLGSLDGELPSKLLLAAKEVTGEVGEVCDVEVGELCMILSAVAENIGAAEVERTLVEG